MTELVCLLEEYSAQVMLAAILPKILPSNIKPIFIVFNGKSDLDRSIRKKLRGYRKPNSVFLVMRDQDSGNCEEIKQNLLDKIDNNKRDKTIVRIVCRELESFYLGDLIAVERGLKLTNIAQRQNNGKFRNPDKFIHASQILKRITNKPYQKVGGSRMISPHLNLDGNNHSHSFNVLLEGIRQLVNNITDNGTP